MNFFDALPSMSEVKQAVGNIISPDQAVQREMGRRRNIDILLTSPNDERYNTIRR